MLIVLFVVIAVAAAFQIVIASGQQPSLPGPASPGSAAEPDRVRSTDRGGVSAAAR